MTTEILKQFDNETFRNNLIEWYEGEQRDLPWRINQDPYRIWVSEIMLQQTRVETVIPYYLNFMKQFPTLEDLAYAEEEKILKAWEGLGYYSRVRNLQTAVREVAENYGGIVPDTKEEISKLKGVGPYTTGAILSIAYNKPEPAVDGNVMRVLSRVLLIEEDIAKTKTRKLFEDVTYELISKEKPSEFNQGIMELGALICTPKSPGCLLCPVREHCRAYEKGVQKELPIKAKKKKATKKEMAAAVIQTNDGQVVIHRRGEKGLLAKLWEFPNHETMDVNKQKQELEAFLRDEYEMDVVLTEKVQNVEHTFSHLIWNITVYKAELKSGLPKRDDIALVDRNSVESYPFPVSHQKIIEHNLLRG
ncbi:A/G-specific adenine glycosylase [Bacillus alkalicellulosilyticus]|uniref:A/G-specific adenine glycosylase n=1 Tax=Alkalihalobacterium alkalicellulosilyticum TaxID=1912214 RepID=UPI00099677D4|nr:A/G-specific adenine glycosylase [Bacillus alkalicellulosilyticus]